MLVHGELVRYVLLNQARHQFLKRFQKVPEILQRQVETALLSVMKSSPVLRIQIPGLQKLFEEETALLLSQEILRDLPFLQLS